MDTSVVKNDQATQGGATSPAIVKSETEHSQGTETPGDRHESSGNTAVIIIYILTVQLNTCLFNACFLFFKHKQTKWQNTNGYKAGV